MLASSGTALVIASCGGVDTDYGLGTLYPVSGTVTYNDKPLEKGQINFMPEDLKTGVGATGTIENGTYAMGTAGDKNGARAGKYKVIIISKEDSEELAKSLYEKDLAKKSDQIKNTRTSRIPNQYISRAAMEAKSLVPLGYSDLRTTNLTADVLAKSNTLDFKLTDADAPTESPKTTGKGKGRR
jgi:hypothetical protein